MSATVTVLYICSLISLSPQLVSSHHHSYLVTLKRWVQAGFQLRSIQLPRAFISITPNTASSKGLCGSSDPQTFIEVVAHMSTKFPVSDTLHLECWT